MTVLLLFILALSFSISTTFAADNTTSTSKLTTQKSFTSSQINSAAGKVKTYVETNKKLPNTVTINNAQVTMPQFLKLMATNTVNLNNKKTSSVTVKTVKDPTSTATETVKSGTLTKSKYVSYAKTIDQHITKYGTAPSSVSTSLGKINFQNTVYTYSKILNFQSANKRLPNTVSVAPSKITTTKVTAEGTGSTVGTTVKFTSAQINTAAGKVKTYVETNKKIPSTVTINNRKVTIAQFLKLMATNTVNINNKKTSSVTLKTVKDPASATETVKTGTLTKSQYVTLAKTINTYINSNGKAPNYVKTSLGNMRFESLVYTLSKVLNFQATNKRLPNTVSVTPWKTVSSKTTSEGTSSSGLRPVYIMSDYINGASTDNARINTLVSALKKLGLKAYNYALGPNSPKILMDKKVPSNALVVNIWGGACAGTIKDVGSNWYKSLIGNKKVFFVWTNGATKLTGLNWLPRAHDDNFSPSSFKGLANPDKFLKNNGYQFYEGYTNSKANDLAKILYNMAKS